MRRITLIGRLRPTMSSTLAVVLVTSIAAVGFGPAPASADPARAAAVVPDPLPRESTSAAGAIAATHAVTESGQATYTVGIEVPPGPAGLAPEIALTASSAGGDGLVGEGWTISGFSAIDRCALSSAQSGGYARPIEDPAGRPDGFCLDGELLVVVAGAYGAEGSEYRTEVDTFSRIIATGVDANGPQGFEVRTKDGAILRYGFATDAVASVDGKRRRWAIKEQQDRSGNYLEVAYARVCTPPQPIPTCSRFAPSEVRYGGHRSPSGAVQAHDRLVRLVYEEREDGWSAHSRGLRDLEWRRLSRVETVVGGVVARRYKVAYDTRQDVSRVTQLSECVDDAAAEVCKPPTTFTYDNGQGFTPTPADGPVVPLIFGNGLGSQAVGATIVLDATGDGRDDIVFSSPERRYSCDPSLSHCDGAWEFRLAVATGDRSSPYTVVDLDLGSQPDLGFPFWCLSQDSVVDYNGDGRDDLVSTCGFRKNGTVLVSTGQGFAQERIPVIPEDTLDPFWLADVNGDALADVLVCKRSSLLLHLNRGPGAGFEAGRTLPNYGNEGDSPMTGWRGGRGTEPCEAPMFVDVDGDGVVNMMKRQWELTATPDTDTSVWTQTWKALSIDPGAARWIDTGLAFDETINSDLPDAEDIFDVTPYWAEDVSEGDDVELPGSVTVTSYARKWQMRVADVNGDGLEDVIRYDGTLQNRARLHINTGKGFGVDSPTLLGDPSWDWYRISAYGFARAQFLDYDNDGRTDVLLPVGDPAQPDSMRWVVHRVRDRSSFVPELIGTMNIALQTLPIRADADGDGSSELILADDDGALEDQHGNPAARMKIRWGSYARGNKIVTARTGMGQSVLFGYSTLDAQLQPVYRRTAGCRPAHSWCQARVGPLVSSVQVRTVERTPTPPFERFRRITFRTFHYEDARRAWYGRGTLGFARRISTSFGETNDDLIETVTTDYDNTTHQDVTPGSAIRHWFPFAGRPVAEESRSGPIKHGLAGQPDIERVQRTDPIRHEARLSTASVPFAVNTTSTRTETMRAIATGVGRTVKSIETSSAHDADGNQLASVVAVRNGQGGEVSRTRTETTYDTSAARRAQWLLGLPARTVTTHSRQGAADTRTVGYTFTADRGLAETSTIEPDDPALRVVETSTHDEFGNVVRKDLSGAGETTRTTRTAYDPRGLFPTVITNPAGHGSTMVTDPALGSTLVQVDPNGVVVRFAYDGFGRIRLERGPSGDTVTTYARADSDTGALLRARVRATTQVAGGATTDEYADGLGRSIETRTSGYAGTTVISETTYDHADRQTSVTRPHLPGDNSQGVNRFTYDAIGRVTTTSRPDDSASNGVATSVLRYGWPDEAPGAGTFTGSVRVAGTDAVAVLDPLGRTTVQVDDAGGSLVASVDATGAATQVEYGPFEAARRILDPAGSVTAFEVDRLGRNTAVTSADTGRHGYLWSRFGQLSRHLDPRGINSDYQYDTLGRTIRRTDPRGVATWTYDGPGPNAIGKLVESAGPDGTRTVHRYEEQPATGPNRGMLASTEQIVGSRSHLIGYSYDAFARLSHIEYPAAGALRFGVDHVYDTNGQLTQVRDSATARPYWSFVDDDQGYRIGVERLGNGVTTTSRFQALSGRLSGTFSANGSAPEVQHLDYGYDSAGNVRQTVDSVRPDRSRAYTYDAANRLSRAQTPQNQTVEQYTYDRAGNITSQLGVGAYGYGTTGRLPNAVVRAGDNTFGYDAAGNQTDRRGPGVTGTVQTIAYTPANLPDRVVTGLETVAKTTTFGYGADEQRVQRRAPDAVTTYVGGLYERRETPAGEIEHRYYVQAGERPVAQVVRPEMGGRVVRSITAYAHPDRLGSPVDHSDEAGAAGHSQLFTSYGVNREPDWRATGERGFAGKQTDSDLGLIDMSGRTYDPLLGRFLSVDPALVDATGGDETPQDRLLSRAGNATGGSAEMPATSAADLLQPYAYGANNPLAFADRDGRNPTPGYYRAQGFMTQLAATPVGQAVTGYLVGVTQGAAPGGFLAGPAFNHIAPSRTFEFFRGAGEASYGIVQMFGGAGGAAGGGALSATGVGAPIGAPAAVASAAVAVEGAADAIAGAATMVNALFFMDSPEPGGGGENTGGPATPAAAPVQSAPQPAAGAASGPVYGPMQLPSISPAAIAKRAADLKAVLKSWTPKSIKAAGQTFKFEKDGLEHILERHHPKYWNGQTKATQTFLEEGHTIADVERIVEGVMSQNAKALAKHGTKTQNFQIHGKVDGVEWTLGFRFGNVWQLFRK